MSLTPYDSSMFPNMGLGYDQNMMMDPYNPWQTQQAMAPWNVGSQLVNPNQTGAAREIRRDLIRPYSPILSADLVESDTDFHIHADLPGVEDMTIEVVGRNLVIKAERKVVHDTDADMVHSVERSYGKVQRTILLPENADIDKAISKFVDGVLTVSFPKKNMDIPFTKKLMISNR